MKRGNFCRLEAMGFLIILSVSTVPAQLENMGRGVTPYRFERINDQNFHSQGWMEQYFDGLIIGTTDQNHSTMFDFTCDSSDR